MSFREVERERHVELQWSGPYGLRDGRLALHPLGPTVLPDDGPGLYLATSDHPLRGTHALSYIGETGRLVSQRLIEHEWFEWEWRLEIYIAYLDERALRRDVESLLIYAHQPAGNSKGISSPPALGTPFRIWNAGRFWGLFPEVSSQHEWFRDPHKSPLVRRPE